MNIDFVITRFGKFKPSLFSDKALDVASSVRMPMPPRVGEVVSVTMNGDDYNGRHAYLEVLDVMYIEMRGTDPDCDLHAVCHCKVRETWVRSDQ